MNIYLLRRILTKRVEVTQIICKQIYDVEARVHEGKDSEIYLCLHNKFDPLIVDHVIDGKFPGIVSRLTLWLENKISKQCFTWIANKKRENEKVSRFFATFKRIIALEGQYFDQLKDTALTLWLLELVGGYQSLIDLPTNFTSFVIYTMSFSIIVPLTLSGLHLAVNNPCMVWMNKFKRLPYNLSKFLCILFSAIMPMLLKNTYEQAKESTRKLAKHYDYGVLPATSKTRAIHTQMLSFLRIELGMETFVQVTLQILILMIARTETATTGGLETIFNKKSFGMDPVFILSLSIAWSLLSCVRTHTRVISSEKGFCPFSSKIFIFTWGMFATLRRVLSIIAMFTPAMGLFSILHHSRAEQIPFRIRLEYAKKFTIKTDDKITLHGLNETIFWSELDRWDYSDPFNPKPPHYKNYTLLSLKQTFIMLLLLTFFQFFAIFILKSLISDDFRKKNQRINKFIHVLENLNYAFPFKDWDDGKLKQNEFKERRNYLKIEMAAIFLVNIVMAFIMLVPVWHCGM